MKKVKMYYIRWIFSQVLVLDQNKTIDVILLQLNLIDYKTLQEYTDIPFLFYPQNLILELPTFTCLLKFVFKSTFTCKIVIKIVIFEYLKLICYINK